MLKALEAKHHFLTSLPVLELFPFRQGNHDPINRKLRHAPTSGDDRHAISGAHAQGSARAPPPNELVSVVRVGEESTVVADAKASHGIMVTHPPDTKLSREYFNGSWWLTSDKY